MNMIHRDDCIVALATPWSSSAIAVIRMSGKGCIENAASLFPAGNLENWKGNTIQRLSVTSKDGRNLDEVMAAVFREPASYTGEDSVEIYCHGSLPVIHSILEELKKAGFRDALPGEFTMRAFLNGKMDLTEAEAVDELVRAKTERAGSFALSRLHGEIRDLIEENKKRLLKIQAGIEIQLDYPEDEISGEIPEADEVYEIRNTLLKLANTYSTGRLYQEGAVISIGGKTNVGKSSLFNRFLREDRAIVSTEHGTTRDYLEAWITLGGIPVRIVDTAGLREAHGVVEIEGIRRSREILSRSDGVVYLLDAETGMTEDDKRFIETHRERENLLVVWNKVDKNEVNNDDAFCRVSALTGEGFELLENKLRRMIVANAGGKSEGNLPVIDSLRQRLLLERAAEALDRFRVGLNTETTFDLLAVDLKEALDALGEITGEVTSADILEEIFSRFCVGK